MTLVSEVERYGLVDVLTPVIFEVAATYAFNISTLVTLLTKTQLVELFLDKYHDHDYNILRVVVETILDCRKKFPRYERPRV